MKYCVGISGVVITIIGWIVSNADHFPFVYRILAPKYLNAISAFNRMHQKNFILREEDVGFSQIVEILKEDIRGNGVPTITHIKTLSWGAGLGGTPDTKWRDYIEIQVSFSNGRAVTGKLHELKARIEKRYLVRTVFSSSSIIFWIGIAISVVAVTL